MNIKHCLRCGGDWRYRGDGNPRRCGRCKSPYWDSLKKEDSGERVTEDLRKEEKVVVKSQNPKSAIAYVNRSLLANTSKKVDTDTPTVGRKCPHGYMNWLTCLACNDRSNGL